MQPEDLRYDGEVRREMEFSSAELTEVREAPGLITSTGKDAHPDNDHRSDPCSRQLTRCPAHLSPELSA